MTLLFPTPVVYDGDDARYLARDGARFIDPLAEAGHAGLKVVLSEPGTSLRPVDTRLRTGTYADWCNPGFWNAFHADAALCYFGFAARRHLPVVRAMRATGLRLALKTDSSFGLHRFPRHASVWCRKCYWVARERHSPPMALAKTAFDMARWIRGPHSAAMAEYLGQFDVISAESPMAVENTRIWLERHGRTDAASCVVFLPHPVPDGFDFDPARDRKENMVLAVAADWRNPRKGGGVLAGALRRFLAEHPDWRAVVAGTASGDILRAAGATGRVVALDRLPSEGLLPSYRAAKIFISASGSESGPIVAFEALACGCSLVFPQELLQLRWIVDAGLATMSRRRSPDALAEALKREAVAWGGKDRRPPLAPLPPLQAADQLEPLLESLCLSAGKTHP